jgi:16S rRNA (cytidine1402-2'-O)-methyltransferase
VAGTLIFFEAPGRLEASLEALAEIFGPDCPAAIARELTKLHEELRRGDLAELCAWAKASEPRGEFVILAAPLRAADRQASDDDIAAALAAQTAGSLRDRVDAVVQVLRAPRKRVYDLALRSRKDRSQ